MPLAALETGVPWTWETFGEYLDALDGATAVNAGFLVGHCALRRYVMGADAIGNEATPSSSTEMERVLQRVARRRWARILDHALEHPLRRRRPTRRLALGDAGRVAARCATDHRRARGHDARRHRRRAASTSSATTRSSCSSPCPRRPAGRSTGTSSPSTRECPSASPVSSRRRPRPPRHGGAHRRADHAGARADEHELRDVLRAQPHPRLGRHPEPARPRAHGQAARSRRPRGDDGAGAQQGGRRVPPTRRTSASTSSATRTRRPTRG